MGVPYVVSVRSLCEFTAKSGDLSGRFTPTPTAQQGIAGHNVVAARRACGYLRELSLSGEHAGLLVRGRADGYDPARNLLEEFKTHRGDLERMPGNHRALHWAQLKTYGALLCTARRLPEIDLALVYFDIDSEAETSLTERVSATSLQDQFENLCTRFLQWAARETLHRIERDRWLATLPFPHAELRTGQRQMAQAVYRAALRGNLLMVQAPTGIGKTMGTLFPLLKAAPKGGIDRIFYLAAKTPGRALALAAVRQLAADGLAPLRTLELAAKETVCLYPGRACEAASCPLAQGFYDRLPRARDQAVALLFMDRAALRRIALEHDVCPYYLGQELARWCDFVIGDYHYFFHFRALLPALAAQNDWRVGVLVDEAHNLLPRARDMYSATLNPESLLAARAHAPRAVVAPLRHVQSVWRSIPRQTGDYAVHAEIPPALLASLQRATTAIGDFMALDPTTVADTLLQFYFEALHFCRMADEFAGHSLFDVRHSGLDSTLCIRNVNPGPFLRGRFAACHTAVLFSATLAPADYYRQLLGLPQRCAWLDVESPFSDGQLQVRVESRISTRYRDRSSSLDPLVALMQQQYRALPGNYLAFFSSFDYLKTALLRFKTRYPAIPVREQVRGMAAAERETFLATFSDRGNGIGFAVLGGAFAEGIDLPGTRLIGAFIVTLGLPQVNEVNAQVERRMQAAFGAGYEYTYLYPGLQKVVQAAGRVIRTTSDRGTVYLIDDRYAGARVRALLPDWWRVQ